MINKTTIELWKIEDLRILDPCCGNCNFHLDIHNSKKIGSSFTWYIIIKILILAKTIDNIILKKFEIKTSSYLHKIFNKQKYTNLFIQCK